MGTIIYDSETSTVSFGISLVQFKTYNIEIHGDGGGGGFSTPDFVGGKGSSGTYINCKYTPKENVKIDITFGGGGNVGTSGKGGKGGSGSSIIDSDHSGEIVSIMAGGGGGGGTATSSANGADATTGSLNQIKPVSEPYYTLTTVDAPTDENGTGGAGSKNGVNGTGGRGGGVGGSSNVFINTNKGTITNIDLSVSNRSLGGAAGAKGTKGYVRITLPKIEYLDSAIYSVGVVSTDISDETRLTVNKAKYAFNTFVANYDFDNQNNNTVTDLASAFIAAVTSYYSMIMIGNSKNDAFTIFLLKPLITESATNVENAVINVQTTADNNTATNTPFEAAASAAEAKAAYDTAAAAKAEAKAAYDTAADANKADAKTAYDTATKAANDAKTAYDTAAANAKTKAGLAALATMDAVVEIVRSNNSLKGEIARKIIDNIKNTFLERFI